MKNKLWFFIALLFSFLEIQASEPPPSWCTDVVNKHVMLKKFVESSDNTDDTKSSEKSSNRSVESANTLGSFCFISYSEGRETTVLFPSQNGSILYTSALQTSKDENDSLPCFEEMTQHWQRHVPEEGTLVYSAASEVFKKIKPALDSLVQTKSDVVEQSFSPERLQELIKMQRDFCLAEEDQEWKKSVTFACEEMSQNLRPIFQVKATDMNNLRMIPFNLLRDNTQVAQATKTFITTITKHGWHAEQRMLFKAGKLIQDQQGEAPQNLVLCLYTDNTPCHSFKEDGSVDDKRNQCRCRQTLHNLSQKQTLGDAFPLLKNHLWRNVPFQLTVSFTYKYDMDSVPAGGPNDFAPWLFHLSEDNKVSSSWTNCQLSKKDAKNASRQREEVTSRTEKEEDCKRKPKQAKLASQPILVDEINRMHNQWCRGSQCECANPADQWKHIQDTIKDLLSYSAISEGAAATE